MASEGDRRMDVELTLEDIKILNAQDIKTLAKWWCDFNSWEWVEELPNPETKKERWDRTGNGRASAFMDWIDDRIGDREISKHWNTVKMMGDKPNMTVEKWEAWYKEHGRDN